jgi:hypothetical protein
MKLALLAAVFLGVLLAVLFSVGAGRDKRPNFAVPDRSPTTATHAILKGEDQGLEILVRRRLLETGSSEFLDRSLSESLGVPPGVWVFFEAVLVNRGEGSRTLTGEPIAFEDYSGATIPAVRVRDLPRSSLGPASRSSLLAVWSSPELVLPPNTIRREILGVPAGTALESLARGTWGGVKLDRGTANDRVLLSWLNGDMEREGFLQAVVSKETDSLPKRSENR